MARLGAPILLGVVTVLALVLLTSGGEDEQNLRETLHVSATYYDSGDVEIRYVDDSGGTDSVVLEILGMPESFQRVFEGSEFTETVPFDGVPKHGWAVHPVVLEVEHGEFGHVQVKTEIRPDGDPAAPIIYAKQ